MSSYEGEIVLLSFRVALVATLFIAPPATLLGLWLARSTFKFRFIVELFVSVPMVLPPVAIGYILLLIFGRGGFVGQWCSPWLLNKLFNEFWGAALACAVVSFPLYVRSVRVAAERFDWALVDTAYNLGLGRATTYWRIVLPLLWPGLVSGFILSFIRSIGEFGATVSFVGTLVDGSHTLSSALWLALQDPAQENVALRLLVLCVALALSALLAGELVMQKMRARF